MLNRLSANIIAYLCYHIDSICRSNLHSGVITSERDYVSNLGTHLRSPLGPFFSIRLATAQTLPQNLETTFGCDSIIVLRKNNIAKIGLFEAKWPRYFTNHSHRWDSLKTSGESRFSSQIIRQRNWVGSGVVIWEMFFNESTPGRVNWPFDTFGSSCLLHQDAIAYLNANKATIGTLWNNTDLVALLPQAMNLRRIIYNILRCNFGSIFLIERNSISIPINKTAEIRVPILNNVTNVTEAGLNDEIDTFLQETGLTNYISINIEIDE